MDDIFDSLIYILITLAAFAISLLGKKKKPAQRAPISEGTEDHEETGQTPFFSDFERLLDREFVNDDLDTEQEESYHADEQESFESNKPGNQINNEILDSTPSELAEDKEKMPYSIEYDDTSEVFSHSINDGDITKDEESKSIADDFDLEKAVVYSEILNRRDY
ncbi:MAG: hypothetical protein ACQERU_03865 [Bacteroidota bacterium]